MYYTPGALGPKDYERTTTTPTKSSGSYTNLSRPRAVEFTTICQERRTRAANKGHLLLPRSATMDTCHGHWGANADSVDHVVDAGSGTGTRGNVVRRFARRRRAWCPPQ